MNIEKAFRKYKCDKANHGYHKFYERILSDNIETVLEIGVKNGRSLASWKEVDAKVSQKLWAMLTFPFYSLSFLPLFIIAPLTMLNLKWYKTPHSVRGVLTSHGPRP
jgi:hypothetical protein